MNNVTDANQQGPGHKKPGEEVTINVDGTERLIDEGVYKVRDLKALYDIPVDYELDEVVNGDFKPLNDERSLHIKGGEVFVSHVRQGGSS